MTLQALKYFVSVARLGNFTRAARECHMTQPALSRSIAELEAELGCQLFLRSGKGLTLTPAGQVCLTESRRLLRQAGTLQERVRRAGAGAAGHISVGYIIFGYLNAVNQHLFSFLKIHTGVEVETAYDSAPEIKRRLVAGELDLATLSRPSLMDLPPCKSTVLVKNGLSILVHRGHPLFERERLGLRELAGERLVLWDRDDLPLLYDAYVSACEGAGFHPNVVGTGRKLGDLITVTATKNAVGFVNSAIGYAATEDIRLIPITDPTDVFDVMLVMLERNENPAAAALLAHVESAEG